MPEESVATEGGQEEGHDYSALEAAVQANMDAAMDENYVAGSDPVGESGVADEPIGEVIEQEFEDDAQITDELATDDGNETEVEVEVEVEGDQQEAAAKIDLNAPTLPDAYRRSLHANDWSDAEIDQNLKVMGPDFIKIAEKVHASRNNETAGFAQAGRMAREALQNPLQSQEHANTFIAQQPQQLQPVTPLNVEELKEKYGGDEFVGEVAGQLNATIAAINSIIPGIVQGQQATQQAEINAVVKKVDGFFDDKSMSQFTDLYGSADTGILPKQQASREAALNLAWDIMSGAKQTRNIDIPIEEALQSAHEVESREYQEIKVRQGLKKQAVKRQKGISLKPGKAGKSPMERSSAPRNEADFESRTRARMAEAGL